MWVDLSPDVKETYMRPLAAALNLGFISRDTARGAITLIDGGTTPKLIFLAFFSHPGAVH